MSTRSKPAIIIDTHDIEHFNKKIGFGITYLPLNVNAIVISVDGDVDINGDNYKDIMAGLTNLSPNAVAGAGEGFGIWGEPGYKGNFLEVEFQGGDDGFTIIGNSLNGRLGYMVGLKDINGDGYDDFALSGVPDSGYGVGITYVFFGKPGLSSIDINTFSTGTDGFIINGDIRCISSAGDLNNDGYNDIAVGAYNHDELLRYQAGRVVVLYGGTAFGDVDFDTFTTGANGFLIQGPQAQSFIGASLKGINDINGDNRDDIIVGGGMPDDSEGACYVIYGRDTFDTMDLANFTVGVDGFTITASSTASYPFAANLFFDVGGGDDINGDKISDIVIGTDFIDFPGRSFSGAAYVIWGKKGVFASISLDNNGIGNNGILIKGAATNDGCGTSVSMAGDVNGDNLGDFIIGAPYAMKGYGAAYIIYGKKDLPDTIDLDDLTSDQGYIVKGDDPDSYLGCRVRKGGDIDNDGYDEVLIVSAPMGGNDEYGVIFGIWGTEDVISDASYFNPSYICAALTATTVVLMELI